MLAWGWRIERTREGDSMALYNRTRRISQTSQVRSCFPINLVLFSVNNNCLLKWSLWTFWALYACICAYGNNITHRRKAWTLLFKARGTCYCIIHREKPVNAPFLAIILVSVACHPGNLCCFLSSLTIFVSVMRKPLANFNSKSKE